MSLNIKKLKGTINKKNIKFMMMFVVCVAVIFLYGSFRCERPEFKDPLQTKLRLLDLDGWSLTHLFFFMLIGYNYGGKYLVGAFILGVLWEIFEHLYGASRPGWMGGYSDCSKISDQAGGNWWYGKWTDVVMNGSGLIIGYYLQNKSF